MKKHECVTEMVVNRYNDGLAIRLSHIQYNTIQNMILQHAKVSILVMIHRRGGWEWPHMMHGFESKVVH